VIGEPVKRAAHPGGRPAPEGIGHALVASDDKLGASVAELPVPNISTAGRSRSFERRFGARTGTTGAARRICTAVEMFAPRTSSVKVTTDRASACVKLRRSPWTTSSKTPSIVIRSPVSS
jgi:hypothetical protein